MTEDRPPICPTDDHHQPHPSPYKRNTCVRCGRTIPPRLQPVSDPDRDPERERQIAQSIAGVAVNPLLKFAQQRADPGPVRNFQKRDFIRDGSEEYADIINYSVWGIQQLLHHGMDDEDVGEFYAAFATALVKAVEGFDSLQRVHYAYAQWLKERSNGR